MTAYSALGGGRSATFQGVRENQPE